MEENISTIIIGIKNWRASFKDVILNNLIKDPKIQIDKRLLT